MKKKIGVVCLLLVVLMLFPVVGYKVFTDQEYSGNVINAQEVSAEESLRGVWIATVANIDFPSKQGLTAEQQMKELDSIVENAKYMGLNAIFFQVRPTGDALYKSSIFPWSKYLTGKQGEANDKDFDPLAYIIEQGHKNGIQIHAWLNPLRLSMGTVSKPDKDVKALSENHPARKIPQAVVAAPTGQLYLDPGRPEAVKLITDGIAEIVKNYDIDGIHFDDYFYPSNSDSPSKADFNDKATYEKYKGSFSNKEEWRRNNIDTLVKSAYDTVKSVKPQVQFGISPFAIWSNKDLNEEGSDTQGGISTYYDHYADTKKWVKEAWIDYIAPQIYWNIGFKIADYSVLLDWWKNVCSGTNVKLYVGHAAYKINDASQANEWLDPLQIPKQISMNRESKAVSGSIFYGYSNLKANALGIKEKLRGIYIAGRDPAGPIPEDRQLVIAAPVNGYKTSSSKVSIMGSCDTDQPVFMNGNELKPSTDGYFAVYQDLQVGENTFIFKHKEIETTLKVVRNETAASTPYQMNIPEFRPGYFSPVATMTMKTGQTINFSCQAPAGAKVWVKIGQYQVALKSTGNAESNGGTYTPAKYSGTFNVPAATGSQKVMSLGKPVFYMEYNGKTVAAQQSNTISVQSAKYSKYAVVSVSGSEVFSRSGPASSYSIKALLINGAVDNIVGEQNGYYLLSSGVWVAKQNVKVVNDKPIAENKIKSISVKANGSYTDITFKMPVNALFIAEASTNAVVLNIYNTTGIKFNAAAPASSVFSSVSYKAIPGGAQYTFNLKSPDNYFGYNAQYKNGSLVFSLKNAPKVSKSGSKPLTGLKVILDAGHGGTESGAIGPLGNYGLKEKDINLSIALNTRKSLQALGASVIMTRTSDKTLSLNDRANLIRKEKPDIAVSIHNNSMDVTADYTKHTGLLVLYSRDSSKAAASFFSKSLIADLNRRDESTRLQSLSVCMVTQSPAILIEGAYLSNPEEYQWLSDYNTHVKIANSISKAVENWAYENSR